MQKSNTGQVFWVMAGSLSAFMFSIVSTMILSRYFDKADYGTYRQVIYIYDVMLVVFTLGIPKAYSFFLPRVPVEEAKSLIKKINNVLIASGVLMGLTIFGFAGQIADALNNDSLETPLRYFSLVPVFMLPTMGLEGVLATFRKAKSLAIYNVTTRILMLLCVVLPVVFMEGTVADAMLGFTIASFLTCVAAIFLKFQSIKGYEARRTEITYKMISDFSIPLLFAGLWGIVIKSSDQFFISRYFGKEVFAEYANGALELPFVGMVVSAASIVLAPIYSGKAHENTEESRLEILRLWHTVLLKTVVLIYPALVFFWCFSDFVMLGLYGSQYTASSEFFQIKILVNFFTLVAFGPLILAIGGAKYYGRAHMVAAIFLTTAQSLSIYFSQSPIAIVWISVISQIILIMAMVGFIATYFKLPLVDLFPISLMIKMIALGIIIAYAIRYVLVGFDSALSSLGLLGIALIFFTFLFFISARLIGINYLSMISFFRKK